ncbi:hypothetical protein E5CHR_01286 [Variovorax sp. PBL-E5]|nr:hypothetical protein E5CHR_01286 [Variovorax sp. PBL-E5]
MLPDSQTRQKTKGSSTAGSSTRADSPEILADLFETAGRPYGQLHPRFRLLRDSALLGPARDLLRQLHAAFHDRDFVDRFQTTGFDAALFELFLFAMFKTAGHCVDHSHRDPTFLLTKGETTVAVDALTVGIPTTGIGQPDIVPPQFAAHDKSASHRQRGGSNGAGCSLFRKLQQQHWNLPHTAGKPFVIAVQDFDHMELPQGAPPAAVLHFLFGTQPSHELGQIFPEGFFGQSEAENISAILFCNEATLAKFNRLGQEDHCNHAVRMLRHGSCLGSDCDSPSPAGFVYEVGERPEREDWNEGTVLIHNPYARHPLPRKWLGASAELELENGRVVTGFAHGFHPFASTTETLAGDTPEWWLQRRANLLRKELSAHSPG